jgi:hypothetical protein
VSQLDSELGFRRRYTPSSIKGAFCRRSVSFRIETKAAVANAASALNIRHFRSHHACTRNCEIHPMLDVPIAGTAIVGRILTHGCYRYAIWQVETTEAKRREKMFGHGTDSLLCKIVLVIKNSN